jgi:hypothetical protein
MTLPRRTTGVGDASGVGVSVGKGVKVGVAVLVAVDVTVAVAVGGGVRVRVGSGIAVGVARPGRPQAIARMVRMGRIAYLGFMVGLRSAKYRGSRLSENMDNYQISIFTR